MLLVLILYIKIQWVSSDFGNYEGNTKLNTYQKSTKAKGGSRKSFFYYRAATTGEI